MKSYGPLVLRLFVGTLFMAHGVEHLFGLFGGGLEPLTLSLASIGARPAYLLAAAAAALQLAGGILLMLGALTPWVPLVFAVLKAGVLYKFHIATGALTTQPVIEGRDQLELSILLIGALVTLTLTGPGAFSLDDRRARHQERAAAGRARVRAGNG
jgi:putative oxidoreductase